MRSIILGLALCMVWLPVAGLVRAESPPVSGPSVEMRDDRGETITSALEVCFRTDLRSDCVDLSAGERFLVPAPLRSLRVEGPDHGPASFQGEDLKTGADGRLRLRIPRKALLQIDKLPAEPLDVAVYDPQAASFDKPLAGARGLSPAGVKIPAGELLVALSSGRKAPDLQRLAVQPGAVAHLEYHPREGWSLVVRSRNARNRQAVASAVISLASVPGYGAPSRPVGEGTTGADGLALFPGLAGRRIDAGVRHSEFLPQAVQGLSAAPGGLAFHDVALEEGGRVRARVRARGQPREGAFCKMVDLREPVSTERKDWNPPVLYEGRTDRQGICRTERLSPGSYLFAVRLAEGQSPLERSVTVTNGVEAEEEFSFSEIRAHGTVSRKDDPAPGLTVSVVERHEQPEMYMEVAEATTGQDGTYEIKLAKPGRYTFVLRPSPQAPSISIRDVLMDEDGETAVDFSLEKAALRGKVVDGEGKPVEGAWVRLSWNAVEHGMETGAQGEFEFLLESQGKGYVKARKPGYRESDYQDVALGDESELPPLVVVLAKEMRFHGTLSAVNGLPVAGGWVASLLNPCGDEHVYINHEQTDAAGRFEVAPLEGRRNRLFASGPGCPLSFFDPLDANGELALRCQGRPAVLDVTLTDGEGRPVPNAQLILRQGGAIIPIRLLALHLAFLGLRAETDASGRLVVPNLAPGDYDVFVAEPVTEGMIEAGSRTGYLTSTRLAPLATTELRLTVGGRPGVPAGGG